MRRINYPYGNLHSLNLDWLIHMSKATEAIAKSALARVKDVIEKLPKPATKTTYGTIKAVPGDGHTGAEIQIPLRIKKPGAYSEGEGYINISKGDKNNMGIVKLSGTDPGGNNWLSIFKDGNDRIYADLQPPTASVLGGIIADPVTPEDTQEIHVTPQGRLRTSSIGGGGVSKKYVDELNKETVNTSKTYTDTATNKALADSKTYTDTATNKALADSKTYTDNNVDKVIARGTSDIWTYIKYNSGKCELLGKNKVTNLPIATAWGSEFISDTPIINQTAYPFPILEKYVEVAGISDTDAFCGWYIEAGSNDACPAIWPMRPAVGNISFGTGYIYTLARWK